MVRVPGLPTTDPGIASLKARIRSVAEESSRAQISCSALSDSFGDESTHSQKRDFARKSSGLPLGSPLFTRSAHPSVLVSTSSRAKASSLPILDL